MGVYDVSLVECGYLEWASVGTGCRARKRSNVTASVLRRRGPSEGPGRAMLGKISNGSIFRLVMDVGRTKVVCNLSGRTGKNIFRCNKRVRP